MTSTRFVMRLMIGSIGDRTVSRAFRADSAGVESADLDKDSLRSSSLKRACSSAVSLFKAFYKAGDTVVRAFGPAVDESTMSRQTARSRISPVCRSALLELTLLDGVQSANVKTSSKAALCDSD